MSRLLRALLGVLALATAVPLPGELCSAADRVITSVDPANVVQGDTVLLTIKGENLPGGTVVVSFFPQQIAVLKVLSASPTEVSVQVKVPSLAPPGSYNIVIYNHLGDEAFAPGALTVGSGLVTPVFNDYDPKVIAEATNGFALMLTGDSITPAAIDHLSMQWQLDDKTLGALSTTFGMGGPGTVVCAVSGRPPSGKLRGKVLLDNRPIYLVEVQVQGAEMSIIGHSPSALAANQQSYEIKLVGTGFTPSLLTAFSAELVAPAVTAKALELTFQDEASFTARFAGPMPALVYRLRILSGTKELYAGDVELTNAPAAGAAPVAPEGTPSAPPDSGVTPGSGEAAGSETPAPGPQGEGAPPSGQNGTPAVRITSAAPAVIPAGSTPCRFLVQGEGLSAAICERLQASLIVNNAACSLLFSGVRGGGCAFVFSAPEGGFLPAASGRFSLSDPQGALADFSLDVTVEAQAAATSSEPAGGTPQPPPGDAVAAPGDSNPSGAAAPPEEPAPPEEEVPPAGAASPETPAPAGTPAVPGEETEPRPEAGWSVQSVYLAPDPGPATLLVSLAAPPGSWDPSQLSGTFTLLPEDPAIRDAVSGLTLSGNLAFHEGASGTCIGSFTGNFVPGDLLLKITFAGQPTNVSTHRLEAKAPRVSIAPPPSLDLARQADGSIAPAEVRWVVDFAPLVPTDTSLVEVEADPAPDGPPFGIAIEGTQIVVTQSLAPWQQAKLPRNSIAVRFSSPAQLSWESPQEYELLVRQADSQAVVAAGPLALELVTDEVVLQPEGFNLAFKPGAELTSAALLEGSTVSSQELLLERNLSKFKVETQTSRLNGMDCVVLKFTRDKEALPDLAYRVLAGALEAKGEIALFLTVKDGRQQELQVKFKSAEELVH